MGRRYAVYKGLQKPLVFRGFKGKFIYWGVGCLLAGIVAGALTMVLVNMYLGVLVLIAVIAGGLVYTASRQKRGLYSKGRQKVTFIYPVSFVHPLPFIYSLRSTTNLPYGQKS